MKFPCRCCGYKTLSEPANGTYEICEVCYWEDDPVQLSDPDFAGGANIPSLRQAQQNFLVYGACSEDMKPYVRMPKEDEERDKNWKPVDGK